MARLTRRDVLRGGVAAGTALAFPAIRVKAGNEGEANEAIGLGIIGTGGRGNELARGLSKTTGGRIVAGADPDSGRVAKFTDDHGGTAYTDLRRLIDDPNVDAVLIATCNHWHCLAAIWAMQAGKDVYVEKPLSHSQWEGQQVVNWARKLNKVVQLGTQQRSDPLQAEAKRFLHDEKGLGEILYAQANRLGPRGPIGKRSTPLTPPAEVDYDLWLGPAQDQPLYRDSLHYDWHWDWNTGSGEMGNWGVHVLDDVRNVVYRDSVSTPRRITALGGRVAWDDAGNTPNVHFAYFETDTVPTLIALSNVTKAPGEKGRWVAEAGRPVDAPGTGYIVVCEGGYYLGRRGGGKAVDRDGKTIKEFGGGNMVPLHLQNWLDAVRDRNIDQLNAEIATGHHSTGWCNLANVAYRAAGSGLSEPASIDPDFSAWGELIEDVERQLAAYDLTIGSSEIQCSPVFTHDPEAEAFVGPYADAANDFLKRQYRAGFEVPTAS